MRWFRDGSSQPVGDGFDLGDEAAVNRDRLRPRIPGHSNRPDTRGPVSFSEPPGVNGEFHYW